jgi:hypothetical protein
MTFRLIGMRFADKSLPAIAVLRQYSDRPRFTHAGVAIGGQTKTASVRMTLVAIAIGDAKRSRFSSCRLLGASGTNRLSLRPSSVRRKQSRPRRYRPALRRMSVRSRHDPGCTVSQGLECRTETRPRNSTHGLDPRSQSDETGWYVLGDASTRPSPDTSGDSIWC